MGWIAVLAGLAVCAPSFGQQLTTESAETARARRIVRDLADPDTQVRQLATLQLNSLGAEAMVLTDLIATYAPQVEIFTLDLGKQTSLSLSLP